MVKKTRKFIKAEELICNTVRKMYTYSTVARTFSSFSLHVRVVMNLFYPT